MRKPSSRSRSLRSFAIAVLLLGASPLGAAAQTVPTLNVAATCRDIPAETGAIKRDAATCLRAENEARATLAQGWNAFPAADRSVCTQTATMGGTASYVELLTCLELRRDARALPQDQLTRTGR
jgi:hypothetical protein